MQNRDVAVAFGRVLRKLRLQSGLSQEELALRAGLDRAYPSLLEIGRRQPTLAVLIALAKSLNMKPEALLCEAMDELEESRRTNLASRRP